MTAVESFRLLGTTLSQDLKRDNQIDSIVKKAQLSSTSRRFYFLRQLRKFNLPQELLIQFYSAIIESVNNCLIQLSEIWRQKTTEGPDSWAIIGTTLPSLQELYLSRVSKKAGKITLDPRTQHTPLWTVTVWSTLQSSEHQNDQTQKQFLSSGNPSHERLTLNVEHTTLLYNYLFTTQIYFSFQIYTCQTSHIIVYIIYCVFAILYIFVYCSFIICVLSCCCHSVALWSFCHYNKFLICVNIPGPIKLISHSLL